MENLGRPQEEGEQRHPVSERGNVGGRRNTEKTETPKQGSKDRSPRHRNGDVRSQHAGRARGRAFLQETGRDKMVREPETDRGLS